MPAIYYQDRIINTEVSDGQLGTSEGTLYTVPSLAQVANVQVTLSNIHASHTNTVSLYLQKVGGTSRRVFYAELDAGDTAYVTFSRLPEGTTIRGLATNANEIDYWISDEQEQTL